MSDDVAPQPIVEASGLSRAYEADDLTVAAIADVSFRVARGEFVAVLGASGAGKSTLLHLLGGLDHPTGGSVKIQGTDLASLSEDALTLFRRQSIGFVFQAFNLLPALSVFENIAIPFIIEGRADPSDEDRIQDMVELFGLRGRERRQATQLSVGEQQRVAIARALLTEPALVIADEPTGNMDSVTGLEILQLLWESCDNFGQTILLATHHPRVATFADRLLFLSDGRLLSELELGRRDEHSDAKPIIDRLQALGL